MILNVSHRGTDNASGRAHGEFVRMQQQTAAGRDIGAELRGRHRSRARRTRSLIALVVALGVGAAVLLVLFITKRWRTGPQTAW